MVNLTTVSEGKIWGIFDSIITEVFPPSDPNQYGNVTVDYIANLSYMVSYRFEQVAYLQLPPPVGTYVINQYNYSIDQPIKPLAYNGTSTLIYNDTYFFLGGSENGSIVVGSPYYQLDGFQQFVENFAGENDTSLLVNVTDYQVPLQWDVTSGQASYNINSHPLTLNVTTFSVSTSLVVNDTHPSLDALQASLAASFASANVTDVNLTVSLGQFSFLIGGSATYDNATGHLLHYQNNMTSQWNDLMLNGTALYNGSEIMFNGTEESFSTCQLDSFLIYHSVIYQPQSTTIPSSTTSSSTIVNTTTTTTSTTTTSTTTTTLPTTTTSTTPSTTTSVNTTIISTQPVSNTTSTTTTTTTTTSSSSGTTPTNGSSSNNATSSLTTTPSLTTPGLDVTVFVILISNAVFIIFLRRKKMP